jgi:hypothetical protein
MSKQVPVKFLVVMIWVAAITWLLVGISGSSIRRQPPPAQQQKIHHPAPVTTPVPVSQVDQNQDGMISPSESRQLSHVDTFTPVVIFLCVGAATLFSCIICVWAARRIPKKTPATTPPSGEDPDFLDSARIRTDTREPAAPAAETERLRRSDDK